MTAATRTPYAGDIDGTAGRLLLVDTGRCGYALLPRDRRRALLARVWHRRLDRRLARGELPENSRLLAARAAQLVSPSTRRRLARRWDTLAGQAQQAYMRYGPLRRAAGTDEGAGDELQRVGDTLRADRPVFAQGVAIAVTALGNASAAVSRLGSGGEDIAAAIARQALAAMSGVPRQ